MRFYSGIVYRLDDAVRPTDGNFSYFILDIRGEESGYIHFGYERYFKVGAASRLFWEIKENGRWVTRHLRIPFVKRGGRLEFDLPEYLKSKGIRFKLYKRYNFYEGCNTCYGLTYCKNAEIITDSIWMDGTVYYLTIIFEKPVLRLAGRIVDKISAESLHSFGDFIDFLKLHLDQPINLSFAELGEIIERFKVRKDSPFLVIKYADNTEAKGDQIDWNDTKK